jgi:general stress protein 26
MASLEEVSNYPLDDEQRERLFALQRMCVVCWSTSDGWPVGVTHRYLWKDGRIWVTTSSQRHRVTALRSRPKSCVVISGDGTEMGADCTLTLKTTCVVHDDRKTLEWFLDAFVEALHPGNAAAQQGMKTMMDTPRRVVLELEPQKWISYDGMKLAAAIAREGITD